MKKLICLCLTLFFLASLASADDVIKREFDISKGGKLVLETEIGGDIYIKGSDENKVVVKAEVIRMDESDYNMDFDDGSGKLYITVERNGRWRNHDRGEIDFSIKVPNEIDIEIETAAGPVVVEDVKGNVSGQTNGGSLDFYGIDGDIAFRTTSRRVHKIK